jgi:hypothetical protein
MTQENICELNESFQTEMNYVYFTLYENRQIIRHIFIKCQKIELIYSSTTLQRDRKRGFIQMIKNQKVTLVFIVGLKNGIQQTFEVLNSEGKWMK